MYMGVQFRDWGMPHMGWGYGMGLFGALLMLVFWVAVIVGIVYLIKWLAASTKKPGDTPMEILRKRYASGEITKEEFEEKKKDLLG